RRSQDGCAGGTSCRRRRAGSRSGASPLVRLHRGLAGGGVDRLGRRVPAARYDAYSGSVRLGAAAACLDDWFRHPPLLGAALRGGDGAAARPIGRPRDERADQAILQVTLELIAERGVHGFRTEDVAARGAVREGAVALR